MTTTSMVAWYIFKTEQMAGQPLLVMNYIWVRSRNCGCLVTWFCYQMIAKPGNKTAHYHDVIMTTVASQITSLAVVYSTVYSDADQRKHQSSASLAFVWGIHRGSVNSPHKGPVTRKMFPFDDVIMRSSVTWPIWHLATVSICYARLSLSYFWFGNKLIEIDVSY